MKPTTNEIDEFTTAVWQAMLFTAGSLSDNGNAEFMPSACPGLETSLHDHEMAELKSDIEGFLGGDDIVKLIREGPGFKQAGHDFHLTRNGHGCGFWDGDWAEPGATVLTDWSKTFGSSELDTGTEEDPDAEGAWTDSQGYYAVHH
jgi:hypothetical protein